MQRIGVVGATGASKFWLYQVSGSSLLSRPELRTSSKQDQGRDPKRIGLIKNTIWLGKWWPAIVCGVGLSPKISDTSDFYKGHHQDLFWETTRSQWGYGVSTRGVRIQSRRIEIAPATSMMGIQPFWGYKPLQGESKINHPTPTVSHFHERERQLERVIPKSPLGFCNYSQRFKPQNWGFKSTSKAPSYFAAWPNNLGKSLETPGKQGCRGRQGKAPGRQAACRIKAATCNPGVRRMNN